MDDEPPRRPTEDEYLARVETLANDVIQAALDEKSFEVYLDEGSKTALQESITTLARNLRHWHYTGDGCIEDDHVQPQKDLFDAVEGLSERLWRAGHRTIAAQLHLSTLAPSPADALPQVRDSLRAISDAKDLVHELGLQEQLDRLISLVDELLRTSRSGP